VTYLVVGDQPEIEGWRREHEAVPSLLPGLINVLVHIRCVIEHSKEADAAAQITLLGGLSPARRHLRCCDGR